MMTVRLVAAMGCVVFALGQEVARAVEIRLREEAQCSGPLVCLGDIAQIDPPSMDQGPSLADLALFPAPAAGKQRQLRRQELLELLALCDVDVRACQFTGADAVVIRSGPSNERTIIRPALHLIPSSQYVQKPPAPFDPRAAAGARPVGETKLVQRNSAVTIHSVWPGVKVTASGKSLGDAALGESVLIEQTDSKQRVLAKVVGPQTVELRPESK